MYKKVFLSIVFLLIMNINICSFAEISEGLIAHFKFDGDITDSSDYNNQGIENGNIQYVDSISGKGLKLPGVNSTGGTQNPDHVKVNKSENLKLQNALSVSYFVRIDGNMQQTSANCSGDLVEWIYGNVLTIRGDRNTFYFNESEYSSALLMNKGKGLNVTELPTVYQNYRHTAYVIDGNYIKIYINGVLLSEGEGIINYNDLENMDLHIGVQESSSTSCLKYWYPLDGVIDELRIYNRVLTDCEINQLYSTVNQSDSDKDGVLDIWDKCANTPQGSWVNNNGCRGDVRYTEEDMMNMVNNLLQWDVNKDKQIGLIEVLKILRDTAGVIKQGSSVSGSSHSGQTQISDSETGVPLEGSESTTDTINSGTGDIGDPKVIDGI